MRLPVTQEITGSNPVRVANFGVVMTKKFTYDDLQPRVEMLIEALENKGSCASGLPYNNGVVEYAQDYRDLLEIIRQKQTTEELLTQALSLTKMMTLYKAGKNQLDRIRKIVEALDECMLKEFKKYNI